jgi:hypothetical protein
MILLAFALVVAILAMFMTSVLPAGRDSPVTAVARFEAVEGLCRRRRQVAVLVDRRDVTPQPTAGVVGRHRRVRGEDLDLLRAVPAGDRGLAADRVVCDVGHDHTVI